MILAGDSAGGNLACVLSSLVRDHLDADLIPYQAGTPAIHISHQILIYPALFMRRYVKEDFADGLVFIPKPVTNWFRHSYLPGLTEQDLEDMSRHERRLCPLNAGFHHMPPTILVSAGMDQLRHENRITVQKLSSSGVDVVHRHVDGVPHGFMTFHFLQEARETLDQICLDLKRELPPPQPPRLENEMLGRRVEILGCIGARGVITELRSSDSVAIIHLRGPSDGVGWGVAYSPISNLMIL